MNHNVSAFLATLVIASASYAHDLKAELQALAPSGQTMRLVYQKGGPLCQDNGYGSSNAANPNTAIYTVTSADGVIKKTYPSGTATGNYHVVHITYDGNRIVFYDFDASQVAVINYATGAEMKRFTTPTLYDYWYNETDGTEWAITCNDNSLTRYNINLQTPAAVTMIASMGSYCQVSDARTVTISDDGLKVLLCKDDRATLLTLAAGTTVNGQSGCWYMMRSAVNSSGRIEFSQNGTTLTGHRGPTIINDAGTVMGSVHVSDTLDRFTSRNPSLETSSCSGTPNGHHCADGLRWLRNRDYFSVSIQECKVGPVLWRMTDNKWTYIEETLNCEYAGDMDGITASSFTDVVQQPSLRSGAVVRQTRATRSYSAEGRLLAQPVKGMHPHEGVAIGQSANGAASRISR